MVGEVINGAIYFVNKSKMDIAQLGNRAQEKVQLYVKRKVQTKENIHNSTKIIYNQKIYRHKT